MRKINFLLVFGFFVTIATYDAHAKYCNSGTKKAPAGTYCGSLVVKDCKPGCYCTGGGNFTWWIGDVEKGCKNRWAKVDTELSGKAGVHLCPEYFPKSNSGAKSASDCYFEGNNKQAVYNKKYSCSAGKYLKKNTKDCETCTANHYCPGGSWTPSKTSNQGLNKCSNNLPSKPGSKSSSDCKVEYISCSAGYYIMSDDNVCDNKCPEGFYCPGGKYQQTEVGNSKIKCPDGLISDAGSDSESDCRAWSTKCNSGLYLPKESKSCSTCPEDHYCPGGESFNVASYDQGKNKCPAGKVTKGQGKSSASDCVDFSVDITAGYYLPAKLKTQKECNANNTPGRYCPGGTFGYSDQDQGVETCEVGLMPNDNRTACIEKTVTCALGEYLPGNSDVCKKCLVSSVDGVKYKCNGGTFKMKGVAQGISTELNMDIMVTGPLMNNQDKSEVPVVHQCWTKTGDEYKECVAGKYRVFDSYQGELPPEPVEESAGNSETTPDNI